MQDLLGDRIGRDIFIISLSIDPEHDTPAVLKEYTATFNARPGWTFATGRIDDINTIRRRLGLYDSADITQHMGLLTFGNEPEGRWGARRRSMRRRTSSTSCCGGSTRSESTRVAHPHAGRHLAQWNGAVTV